MTATDRNRELLRAWKVAAPKLVAALPDGVEPGPWLRDALDALQVPKLEACAIPALIRVATAAAKDGVALRRRSFDGFIHVGRGGAPRWVLTHHGLVEMLARFAAGKGAEAKLVRENDIFSAKQRPGGAPGDLDFQHGVPRVEDRGEWVAAYATSAFLGGPMKRRAVVTRQEAEEEFARLKPKAPVKLEDFARFLAVVRVIRLLPIEHPTHPPAARLLAAADRFDPPKKPRKAAKKEAAR